MSKFVRRQCLAFALYTAAFAALGNATDQLVLTSHTGGQYTYALDFGLAHNFVFETGHQIKLTGLAGVTNVALLNPFTFNVFDPPVVTPDSVTLTVAANHPAQLGTGGLLPLMTVTSLVQTEGVAQYHVEDGTQTVTGTVAGPGTIPLTVWRPSTGVWFVNPSAGAGFTQQWGLPGDIPLTSDFDGDGLPDYVVWRPQSGMWFILSSNDGLVSSRQWGFPGDIPLAGDFDGDGKADYAVWRPSDGTWYILPAGNPAHPIIKQWGLPDDIPVTADFDGDGKIDFAVWRPSEGNWYITLSSTGTIVVQQWGLPGDMPVAADYDGDGKADYAVWRPSEGNWYILPSNSHAPYTMRWGVMADIPVPRDYDGDGKADIAVWRPSTFVWGIMPSATPNAPRIVSWGFRGDIPVYELQQR